MNLNWGQGIALFYLTFMVVLLFFVFKSTTFNNSLVLDNYYEQDLKYQAHFDKKENNAALSNGIQVQHEKALNQFKIYFPKGKKIQGTVLLFHPEDHRFDSKKEIQLNEENEMIISSKKLLKGRWKIKLDWSDVDRQYYTEKEITI